MTSRLSTRALIATPIAATAVLLAAVSLPATAASTGNVKGVVSVGDKPLKNAKVELFRDIDSDPGGDGDDGVVKRIKTVTTDKFGKYSFSGLKSKKDPKYGLETYSYFVRATDRSGKTVRKSLRVAVKKGKTVKKNFHLNKAAIVTGKVARTDGRSPAGLIVRAADDDSTRPDRGYNPELLPNQVATVRADGTFTLGGLLPRNYDAFSVGGSRYAFACMTVPGAILACDDENSNGVTLSAGQRLALTPITLTKMVSTLSGRLTDARGKAVQDVRVQVETPSGGYVTFSELTGSNGRFAIWGLSSGQYVVRVFDPYLKWAPRYFGGAVMRADAKVVNVVAGTNVGNLNVTLKSKAKVHVKATGSKGAAKLVFTVTSRATGGRPGGTMTVVSGDVSKKVRIVKGKATVTLKGLPSGTAKVTATYSGTKSTQGVAKTFSVKVK